MKSNVSSTIEHNMVSLGSIVDYLSEMLQQLRYFFYVPFVISFLLRNNILFSINFL